jgi:4'-phosphopantetheinyl transferase
MNLWIADSRVLPLAEDFRRILARILPEEAQKALRYVHKADQIRSAAGAFLMRSMALKALRSAGGEEPVRFIRTEYGKPIVENHPELHLSLSHSGSLIVCACSSDPVGVDVEEIRPLQLTDFDAWLTPEETQAIRSAKDPQTEFYRVWTRRESFCKLDGRGIGLFDDPYLRSHYADMGFQFRTFAPPGHVLTLCARRIPSGFAPLDLTPEMWHSL